jgi:chaperonin GroES
MAPAGANCNPVERASGTLCTRVLRTRDGLFGEAEQAIAQRSTWRFAMQFRPLHDRVVVRRLDAEEKTAGGIIIPDTAKEKPMEGEVIAVGPGARDEAGRVVPLDVKASDRILFGKWSGTEVKLDGEELLIMKESDIMGIIEGMPASKRKAA